MDNANPIIVNKKNVYEKSYKLILIIPIILLLFSLIYLYQFNAKNGDLVYRDVSLTGGTTITVFDSNVDVNNLKETLRAQFPDVSVRVIADITTRRQQAFFVETSSSPEEIQTALESLLGYSLNSENSSVEFTGSSLSTGFYQQLRFAILLAFIFMAAVIFFIFRSPIPSLAVILAAFADIVMTIAVIDLFGIPLSIGGIVALLMLIGYSVDTDILLTSRLLRNRDESANMRTLNAFKTGITMTLTAIAAVGISLFIIYSFSETLRQIFTILLVGLSFDIINTWLMNASILRWYMEVKKIE